ncbi:MAG: hypothetical protein H8E38_08035 [SAR324 cluster bacterium]|nr:hypothetical protein [SAR324 cluster bacterium]MBL7035199.1 hypothetical protein [SAR324 cluster bacterium]
MVDQVQDTDLQAGEAEKNKLILLLLSKDLRKSYMKTLVDRLLKTDVTVAIDETNYPEEKQKKYKWILSFPGDLPLGITPDADSVKQVFRVPGSPDLLQEKTASSDTEQLTKLTSRYKEILQICEEREKDPKFFKLAVTDAVLRNKQKILLQFQELVSKLEQEITEVEKPYYQGIGYILSTAIEKITGVAILDGLMKGLINVMIIDDLGQRTQDGLVKIDFSRKFLSFMPSNELANKIEKFRNDHAEDELSKANIADYVFNSADFEKVDIVFFNSWKFTKDTFPVRVALRKKTIISKQEERKVKQEDQLAVKIEAEEESIKNVKEKLKEVIHSISIIEKSHLEDEDEYQQLNNSRKRIIKDIKRHELRLKELKRPVKAGDEEKIITFDLFEIFKSKQSFLERMGDKAVSLGMGEFWGDHVETDERHSFTKLTEMANFAKEWIKASGRLNKITAQTTHLAEQLDQFVKKNEMLAKVKTAVAKDTVNYQPLLDEHMLDCLELAILSCEISNLSEEQQQL